MLTWADLDSVRDAARRVDRIRQRLAEVRADAGLHGVRYDRPGGSSHGFYSRIEKSAVKIVELENQLQVEELAFIVEKLRLWVKFCDFPDSSARLIFHYRYIDLLPWEIVAKCLGGRFTTDCLRKYHDRYLDEVMEKEA